MKKTLVWIAVLAASLAFGAIPRFADPVLLTDNDTIIDVGNYGAPQMFDWNLDGKKDLVLGQYEYGRIRFYPNLGEDSAAEFNGFSYVQADGQIIQLPYG
jgi:hypothetical protein